MNSKEFKQVFGEIAKKNGFLQAFGGWFKDSPECIAILELQKSKYGDYYQLNIKIFMQKSFGRTYLPTKELIKSPMGDVNGGVPQSFKEVFDFDRVLNDEYRIEKLNELFIDHIIPFTTRTSTKIGIKELESRGEIFLPPAVKQELEKLLS
ncbi:hypothetical protein OK18_00480 [Chryseobacterium gallinarum]|uniref:DUF4304 domain-containing protein n=1 Tax=Chryseobacterium gallinarum TaxID=1324352 RepID=A0A0G3LXF5_CHRGL|nr:DUF4304 domain-containing protein [Chryseobacterium gallinarum]AKK71314.1 hypothetical protein OK18_00480 [Chryseobacterium gallinarum]